MAASPAIATAAGAATAALGQLSVIFEKVSRIYPPVRLSAATVPITVVSVHHQRLKYNTLI